MSEYLSESRCLQSCPEEHAIFFLLTVTKFFIVARLSSLQSYVLAIILNSVFYCLSMDILKVLASYYLGI